MVKSRPSLLVWDVLFYASMLAGAVAIFCAPVLLAYWVSSAACSAKWRDSGMESSYSLFAGCRVKLSDVTWVPDGTVRNLPWAK